MSALVSETPFPRRTPGCLDWVRRTRRHTPALPSHLASNTDGCEGFCVAAGESYMSKRLSRLLGWALGFVEATRGVQITHKQCRNIFIEMALSPAAPFTQAEQDGAAWLMGNSVREWYVPLLRLPG